MTTVLSAFPGPSRLKPEPKENDKNPGEGLKRSEKPPGNAQIWLLMLLLGAKAG